LKELGKDGYIYIYSHKLKKNILCEHFQLYSGGVTLKGTTLWDLNYEYPSWNRKEVGFYTWYFTIRERDDNTYLSISSDARYGKPWNSFVSHPSFYLFPSPPMKLKLGLQIGERLLIATHLDQSNHPAN
jgi:hypothetical protein